MRTLEEILAETGDTKALGEKVAALSTQLDATNKELAELKAKSNGAAGETKPETKEEPKLTATELCLKARAETPPVDQPLSLTPDQIDRFTGATLAVLQARASKNNN
jgi:hypothetical protein